MQSTRERSLNQHSKWSLDSNIRNDTKLFFTKNLVSISFEEKDCGCKAKCFMAAIMGKCITLKVAIRTKAMLLVLRVEQLFLFTVQGATTKHLKTFGHW